MFKQTPLAPPRKILLATDLSPRGDRALDRAAQLARQWGAHLTVVHAAEPEPAKSAWRELDAPAWLRAPHNNSAIERDLRRDLREDVADLTVLVQEGAPTQVILDVIERESCDLVILGGARGGLFGATSLGSTVEHLVRRSPVSVLVVKTRTRRPYGHVLVGTDFTEESRHGLVAATRLFPEAAFTLMHAFEMPYRSLLLDNQLSHDFAAMEVATIEAFLNEADIAPDIRARIRTTIEHGPPETMFSTYIEEHEADLTVIGAFGRGLLFHMLIGGTARRIVDAAANDVLVVRAPNDG